MITTIDKLYPDIWHYVFEYFDTIELFYSFTNVTSATNEVLFNNSSNYYFRRLQLDSFVETLPENLPLSRIHSLEIHREITQINIIGKCSALRSLKLIGESEWIVSLLRQIPSDNIQLERLVLVTANLEPLEIALRLAGSMCSLRQLEIYTDEISENIRLNNLLINETRIESFTLHSSSSIGWGDMLNLSSALSNIHSIHATLFRESKNYHLPFNFWKLRCIRLILIEVSFDSLIQVVITTPFLAKLKLTGLIDIEGYVVNQKWNNLFNFCPSVDAIRINLSLEEVGNNFRNETILTDLNELNLELRCLDDQCDHFYVNESNQIRWWKLSGTIKRHNRLGR